MNKKLIIKYFIYLFIFLAVIFMNCENSENFFDTEPVEIEDYYPENEFIYDSYPTITVKFTKKMNTSSVEDSFSFEEDGEKIAGIFSWSNNDHSLSFKPEKVCLYGRKYTIAITTGAEDINGNDLKEKFEHNFQLGEDTILPYVVDYNPEDNEQLDATADLRHPIIIVFSEPMDKSYPHNNLTISPDIPGVFEWLDALNNVVPENSALPSSVLRFTPVKDYTKQEYYTVTVGDTFTDIAKNALNTSYGNTVFKFYMGNDYAKPVVLNVEALSGPGLALIESSQTSTIINEDIEKNDSFIITFSKSMNRDDVIKAISISPSMTINEYIWANNDSQVEIKLKQGVYFEYNNTYKLTILDSAIDISGNSLLKKYEYYFLINGQYSRTPEIISLKYRKYDATSDWSDNILEDPFYLETSAYILDSTSWNDASSDQVIQFEAGFDNNPIYAMSLNSLYNGITFTSEYDKKVQFSFLEILRQTNNIYILYVRVTGYAQAPGGDPDSAVIMSFIGGNTIKDQNDNYMQNSKNILFLFTPPD